MPKNYENGSASHPSPPFNTSIVGSNNNSLPSNSAQVESLLQKSLKKFESELDRFKIDARALNVDYFIKTRKAKFEVRRDELFIRVGGGYVGVDEFLQKYIRDTKSHWLRNSSLKEFQDKGGSPLDSPSSSYLISPQLSNSAAASGVNDTFDREEEEEEEFDPSLVHKPSRDENNVDEINLLEQIQTFSINK